MDAKELAIVILRYSPAQPLFAWKNRHRLAVLAYHSVPDKAQFERHVDHLVSRHNPVSLVDVVDSLEGRRPLPPRSVLVTFDDGDKTIIDNAFPVLQAHAVPGVVFVVAGSIDSTQPHWWDEVEDMVLRGGRVEGWGESNAHALVHRMKREPQELRLAALKELRRTATGDSAGPAANLSSDDVRRLDAGGILVENHTLTHALLDRCDRETVASEITRANARLRSILGHEVFAFAYPNGYYSDPARDALVKAGFRAAFLFDHRLNLLPVADPLRISRLRVDAAVSIDRLAVMLSGLHSALLQARGRV